MYCKFTKMLKLYISVDVTVRYIHHTVGIESLWFFSAQRSVEQMQAG